MIPAAYEPLRLERGLDKERENTKTEKVSESCFEVDKLDSQSVGHDEEKLGKVATVFGGISLAVIDTCTDLGHSMKGVSGRQRIVENVLKGEGE